MPGPGELSSQQPALIIGREAGLARLRALVDPVPQASQVLLVTGEAGMGKTVLLADADPAGSRSQLVPYLRTIAGAPLKRPSLWEQLPPRFLLDETDLAVRLLQDAMQRLRAPGVRGTSSGSLTVLGWAYIDTRRRDEALEVAAEAAGMAEANQMELIAASADVITATVLALRGDSAAARRHADRALAGVDPAECGLVAARARRASASRPRSRPFRLN